MNLPAIPQAAGRFLSQNATTILTATGVVGTVATAVLTARATFQASEIIREQEIKATAEAQEHVFFDKKQKIKAVWPQYIPPILVGTVTIVCIVGANRMSAKRAAALAAAYGLSEQRLQEYKEKVSEKLTGPKKQAVIDEIAQDKVDQHPQKEVIILSGGDVLCFDSITGRYFRSSYEALKQAENKINADLFHHQYASLSSFYQEIGLDPTSFSEHVGWNLAKNEPLTLQITSTLARNNEPCLHVDFEIPPGPNYTQLY